ncbi:MAG TPA: phosphotransferase [Steroidobacteraceae bacterium]|nr:phosphotransferase [Steroidobacteraceae bacterium]
MSKPAADIDLPVTLVRDLLRAQHPDISQLPLAAAASGWDNAIFRLGEELAVRLPRRAAAAALLENEQRWLPLLHARLPLPVPEPIRVGLPQKPYPWRWSVTRWIAGETADRAVPDRGQPKVLADFLDALHTQPPADAPRNPNRGVPLAQRQAAFDRYVTSLTSEGYGIDDRLLNLWSDAVGRPIDVAATWIHGDLHARNVLVTGGRISGVIDWGDMAQGDRATDLASVWFVFPERGSREAAIAACRSVSRHTWQRARGWALLVSLAVLAAGDPELAGLARRTLRCLLDGP